MDYWPAYDYFEVNQTEEKASAHKEGSKKSREKKGAENKHAEDPINFFMYCRNREEVEQVYRKLVKIYHSDEIGDIEGIMIKIINEQCEKARKKFQ